MDAGPHRNRTPSPTFAIRKKDGSPTNAGRKVPSRNRSQKQKRKGASRKSKPKYIDSSDEEEEPARVTLARPGSAMGARLSSRKGAVGAVKLHEPDATNFRQEYHERMVSCMNLVKNSVEDLEYGLLKSDEQNEATVKALYDMRGGLAHKIDELSVQHEQMVQEKKKKKNVELSGRDLAVLSQLESDLGENALNNRIREKVSDFLDQQVLNQRRTEYENFLKGKEARFARSSKAKAVQQRLEDIDKEVELEKQELEREAEEKKQQEEKDAALREREEEQRASREREAQRARELEALSAKERAEAEAEDKKAAELAAIEEKRRQEEERRRQAEEEQRRKEAEAAAAAAAAEQERLRKEQEEEETRRVEEEEAAADAAKELEERVATEHSKKKKKKRSSSKKRKKKASKKQDAEAAAGSMSFNRGGGLFADMK